MRKIEDRLSELGKLVKEEASEGFSLGAADLKWLSGPLIQLMAETAMPMPRLYPASDVGIEAEWTFGPWEASATINLLTRSAWLHVANVVTEEDEEKTVNLETDEGSAELVTFLRKHGQFDVGAETEAALEGLAAQVAGWRRAS